MTLTGKLIGGIAALAATSIGGVALNKHLSPVTIGDLLAKEGLSLLSTSSNQWDSLVNKHKIASETESSGIPKKIKNLDSSSEKQKLQEKCQKLWNSKLNEKDLDKERTKEDLKNWCVTTAKALN